MSEMLYKDFIIIYLFFENHTKKLIVITSEAQCDGLV